MSKLNTDSNKKILKKTKYFFVFCLFLFYMNTVSVAIAQNECQCSGDTVTEECQEVCSSIMGSVRDGCRANGSCELSDLARLAIGISRWILGIVGSLSLLAFVYGGVLWLISAGNRETVQKGRQVVIGAVIGLAIVFGSYLIITYVLVALGYPNALTGEWANIPQ